MSEQPQIRQIGFENVNARDIFANVDQSVGKTVIQQVPRENQPIPSNVRQGSKNFVERYEGELQNIHDKLQEGRGVVVCAVEGMGGVGKTELALQYAYQFKAEYAAQYWLSMRETGLAQAVVTLANPYIALPEALQAATLEQQAEWYWRNWLPTTGKLLVILDDVPDIKSIPDIAMPLDERVQVLITTRERSLDVRFTPVSVDVLAENKALELFRKIVGVTKVDKELETVKQVCETVGYLPLAIELVGEYLVKNRYLTFANLLQRLHLADESLSRDRSERLYGHRGVAAAIQLSWQDLSIASQRVAMLLGLFAPVEILWALVEFIAANAEITEVELNEARSQLDTLHLIQPVDAECNFYKIHSLVHEFFRRHLSKSDTNHQFRQAFVTRLLQTSKVIEPMPTQEKITFVSPAIPHLELLSRKMLDDITNPEEDLIWVFTGIARFYQGRGLYSSATLPLQECLKAAELRLGADHLAVVTSLNNLAVLYELQGKYTEAEPLVLRSLSIIEQKLGEENPSFANCLNNLALLYASQGRYTEAEPFYLRSLSISEKQLGAEHSDIAAILNNLALLYEWQGRYAEAEPFYLRSLSIMEQKLGLDHPDVSTSLHNLTEVYRVQGRYTEAEPLLLRSLSISEKQLGAGHPYVATSLNNLASLYKVQGRYTEAESLYLYSLSIMEQKLGLDHPYVASNLNDLASLYKAQGRYTEAESLYLRSISIREQKLGAEHPYTATSLNNLALLYEVQERYTEAESLYLRSLSIREKKLGAEHSDVDTSLNNLAVLYKSQGRYAEAEPLLLRSLSISEKQLGVEHPDFAASLNNLAYLYKLQGRYAEAEPLYQRALQIAELTLGKDAPNTTIVRENLQQIQRQKNKASLWWWQWIFVILLLSFYGLFNLLRLKK